MPPKNADGKDAGRKANRKTASVQIDGDLAPQTPCAFLARFAALDGGRPGDESRRRTCHPRRGVTAAALHRDRMASVLSLAFVSHRFTGILGIHGGGSFRWRSLFVVLKGGRSGTTAALIRNNFS